MKVIAITERKGDYCIAVIQIPEGMTADQTFVKWIRNKYRSWHDRTDDYILENNTEYASAELTVQILE